MFDQAFNKNTIGKLIRKSDFDRHAYLYDAGEKENIVSMAVEKAQSGFTEPTHFIINIKKGKKLLKPANLHEDLVLRKISENIRKITTVKQSDRNTIVKNLVSFLKEGVVYRIYKLDIKEFYESLSTSYINEKIRKDIYISNTTKDCIVSFLQETKNIGIRGLPRGIQLSATLAELALRKFDKKNCENQYVFFYSRFVDDIIFITSGSEDKNNFIGEIEKNIAPLGLKLNTTKKYDKKINLAHKNTTDILCDFNYLGYNFQVKNDSSGPSKSTFREVKIDIAEKKVKRIKTKVVKSLLDYLASPDIDLLTDRIKIITGNYSLVDRKTGIKRKTGIYYNYNHVNQVSSGELKRLDKFLRMSLLSNNGKVFSRITAAIPFKERKKLLKLTFTNGFKAKTLFDFNQHRMTEIMRCWKYE